MLSLPLVMVVDDNPENLTVIGELLHPAHAVRAANGGQRALRLARLQPQPELILLDVMMPEMDGYEVLQRLRADPETADIPVIFLTALDGAADEERGLQLGAVDYITKPIRPAILLARVRSQLELKRARDQLQQRSDRLERRLAEQQAESQRVLGSGLLALALLAEGHDSASAGHLWRMRQYVQLLARALQQHAGLGEQLGEPMLGQLAQAVPLHDIGNSGLPGHLLNQAHSLSADDWEVVRSHALRGDAALVQAWQWAGGDPAGGADPLPPATAWTLARQIVRSHHERWDGQGYPDGLVGEAIPLAARLVAVADAFDALTTHRPWRDAVPAEQALSEIVRLRGQQFDPLVVEALVACFDDCRRISLQHRAMPAPGGG